MGSPAEVATKSMSEQPFPISRASRGGRRVEASSSGEKGNQVDLDLGLQRPQDGGH